MERSSNKPKPQQATVAKKAHQATEDKIANPRRNPTPPLETKRRLAEPTSDIVAMTTDPSPRRPYTSPRAPRTSPPALSTRGSRSHYVHLYRKPIAHFSFNHSRSVPVSKCLAALLPNDKLILDLIMLKGKGS